MTISNLVQEINNSTLSVEELRTLNELVVRKIKAQKKAAAIINSVNLNEGDVVRVNHPKLEGRTGTIIKIKRTKCSIRFSSLGTYDVPMNIVHAL
jgi:cystathionine beta-lyase/cystathionine gamma-synthase